MLLALGTSVAFGQTSAGEKDYKRFPHVFFGVQGGGQTTFTNYDQLKLITPTASVYVGGWFKPSVGARLHVNGLWNKGGFDNGADFKYDYRYVTTNLDLMLNPITIFGKKDYYPVNLYLIGGIGLNCAWDNGDAFAQKAYMPMAWDGTHLSHNARVGLMVEWNVAKFLGINLEVDANSLNDKYNSKVANKDDWSVTAQLGLAFKFGYRKNTPAKDVAVVTPVTEERNLTLYEQMLNTVDNRMNVWMKRLSGESKTDFLNRTSEENIKTQRLAYTKEVSTEMANDRANSTVRDLLYNRASQKLGVQFTDMPTITLSVPKEDIKSFKNAGDLKFTNTVYNLNPGDKFEVLYTEVLNPSTGKKYTYVNTQDAKFVQSDGYMPLSAVQQDIINNERLQAVATNMVREAKEKSILSDNTTVTVKAEPVSAANGKTDYKVTYTYDVKDGFSVKDDFGPGKYEAEKSAASTVMLNIIKQTLNEDFAKYAKAGKAVDLKLKGSADASPVRGKIAYNGQYGDIKDKTVKVNGKDEKMTVTRASGITSNEQLSLVRAVSVKNYIVKNVEALKGMKVNDSYEVEVSSDEGSQFRRVAVEFLFHDAF